MRWPGRPERAVFLHSQLQTADSLVATLATRAGVLLMPGDARAATLQRLKTFLQERPETSAGEFALPMLTGVVRRTSEQAG
jgi:hypothetical protein